MILSPVEFIKLHKNELINKFIPKDIFSENEQILVCMAGSSGAGKTEIAIHLQKKIGIDNIIRIDADEIKEWIVKTIGGDINHCHDASALAVDKLCDYCF